MVQLYGALYGMGTVSSTMSFRPFSFSPARWDAPGERKECCRGENQPNASASFGRPSDYKFAHDEFFSVSETDAMVVLARSAGTGPPPCSLHAG